MSRKNAILVAHETRMLNIGDDIQALASAQFMGNDAVFVERENLKSYHGENVRMIMNGWFMHDPKQWPPSSAIDPLFLAFHINIKAKDILLSDDNLNYLRQHQPIGCRDLNTMKMLQEKNIDAFFSGCMTLTLGTRYRHEGPRKNICYWVDPFFKIQWNASVILQAAKLCCCRPAAMIRLTRKRCGRLSIRKIVNTAAFFACYRRVFAEDLLLDGVYLNHQGTIVRPSNERELLDQARALVCKYAEAALVVTSRIHCALPCLGLETPVVYIDDAEQQEASSCRLGGLLELFHFLSFEKGGLIVASSWLHGKISFSSIPANKDAYKPLAARLSRAARAFAVSRENDGSNESQSGNAKSGK